MAGDPDSEGSDTQRSRESDTFLPVNITRGEKQSTFRGLLRVEVLAICLVAFLADIIAGMVVSTFSLYAENLGASVVFIGVLTSLTGLTGLVASVPLGVLSDQVGRVKVLSLGLGCFSVTMVLLAIAPGPAFLIPGRLLLGIAMVGSFWIAAAYLGDIVTSDERGLAFGLLTTSMGLGFAVGPLIGGVVTTWANAQAAYYLAAVVGAIAVGVSWLVLGRRQQVVTSANRPQASIRKSLLVARSWPLVAVAIGNVLSAVAFGGAVATFFPLRANELGISAATIGSMFAFRAVVSTLVRLPSGALTGVVGTRWVILGALGVEMIAVAGMGVSTSYHLLLFWLIWEGVGFGGFLASAQAYIAENTVVASRGSAMGFYSMTGGIGNTLAPVLLGAIGASLGLSSVFLVSGLLLAVGMVAMCWIWWRKPGPSPALA